MNLDIQILSQSPIRARTVLLEASAPDIRYPSHQVEKLEISTPDGVEIVYLFSSEAESLFGTAPSLDELAQQFLELPQVQESIQIAARNEMIETQIVWDAIVSNPFMDHGLNFWLNTWSRIQLEDLEIGSDPDDLRCSLAEDMRDYYQQAGMILSHRSGWPLRCLLNHSLQKVDWHWIVKQIVQLAENPRS